MARRRIAFDRGQAQVEALGFAQHRRRYLARRLPRVGGWRGVLDKPLRGQQIGADALLQGIAAHAIAELNAQGLYLVLVVVPGRQRIDLRDAEVGTEVGDAQVPRQFVCEARGAGDGLDTAAQLQAHELFTRRQVDRRGMDVGPPAQRAVANIEVDALPGRLDRRIGRAQPVLHAPLQGCPLHGMGEVEGGDDPAQAPLYGIRIELEGADVGAKIDGLELRLVRFKPQLWREHAVLVADRVRLAGGPVFPWREAKLGFTGPAPLAGDGRLDRNPLLDHLAQQIEAGD